MGMKDFLLKVEEFFVKCKSYYSPKNIKSILKTPKQALNKEQKLKLVIKICLN